MAALARLWAVGPIALLSAVLPARAGAEAKEILRRAGLQKGICVVLGLPKADEPGLVVDLATGGEVTVYFQSPSAAEELAVRRAAEKAGLLGKRVFADRGPWERIHLADSLAGAIWLAPPAQGRVPRAELLRVLHPEGKALVGQEEIVKPFPAGIDSWSQPFHGPDNNPQSRDQVARAPYLTQFIAEPKFCPSPAVTVAAGGRLFRACGHLAHKANQNSMLNTLMALNAYNGTLLWKRPLREGFMILRNTIVATPEVLYLADDKSCKLLDAATGQLKDEIIAPDPEADGSVWKWMALEKGILYALLGGAEFQAPLLRSDDSGLGGWPRANWPGFDYQDPATSWAQGRTLLAIDTRTKKLLWRYREQDLIDGRAACMRNGRIYLLSPERFVACVRADDGSVLWKTSEPNLLAAIGPLFPKQPRWTGLSPFHYARCSDKSLFFCGPRMNRVVAVSTDNGKLLWQKEVPLNDGGSAHLLLRDDAAYAVAEGSSFRLNCDTGEAHTSFQGRRGCTIATGSVDSVFYRAAEGTVRVDLATGRAEHIAPMRPPCYEGVIVADGMLHWGAWKCRCPLSLYGHVALAPAARAGVAQASGLWPTGETPVPPGTVEKLAVRPGDWPCPMGDNQRRCVTPIAMPGRVKQQWTAALPDAGRPTAPVTAGGLAFVGYENGVLRALDAATGQVRWQAYTAGPVYVAPAVWEGRLYAGSADGRVYAFEAATGRCLWAFRAAPAERWIPVLGKLISTWPVAGGVVVRDGVAYAAAGIAHYDGTHVYALDAVTGKLLWCNDTSGTLSPAVKNGVSLQGELHLEGEELRFPGGTVYATARYDLKTGRCLNEPVHQVDSRAGTAYYAYYPEYGQFTPLEHDLADGRTLSYQVLYEGSHQAALAMLKPLTPGTAAPPPNWRLWPKGGTKPARETAWQLPQARRFNAFIVAPNALVAAGQDGSQAFLAAINLQDGSYLWQEKLPVPPAKGGLASDHQGRILLSLSDGRTVCFAPIE
ncbi:MAG: hypothetical protein FJ291_18605 [Planctomycetes bacterium]|nr:hypothetical protein [Planctomycetota bacterium]